MVDRPTQPSVIIVGAGFGGLAAAIALSRVGLTRFTILERADSIGGVWRDNTYPGAACDVPSPLYSFSFEPNPAWPKRFSSQADILEYLRIVFDKYRITPHVRFGSGVDAAEFDAGLGRWRLYTSDGVEHHADVLINAVGQLSRPKLPALPGATSFAGTAFHSAQWDHSVDLSGKRVAVVGTGASAIQVVPTIRPRVAHLTLFQRSAAWVLPKRDITYRRWHHAVFRWVPVTRLAERVAIWGFLEVLSLALVDVPAMRPAIAALARRHLRDQVRDNDLRRRLQPDYAPGCKRALFSNDYFPALEQPNVDVVTDAIASVEPRGIRTVDGTLHEVDVIVYCTGFDTSHFLAPMHVTGLDGAVLADRWRDGARAYLGMSVPEFPNMFVVYGPNTNVGSGSIVYMLESQAGYIAAMVRALRERADTFVEVRPEVEQLFDDQLQRRLDRSVWTLCASWYRNSAGRIQNNWPGTGAAYRRRTRRPDLDDFHFRSVHA